MKKTERLLFAFFIFCSPGLYSCGNNKTTSKAGTSDTLTETEKHLAQNALKGLKVFEGLEVSTFATEPMLICKLHAAIQRGV